MPSQRGVPLPDYRVFETEEFKKQKKRLESRRAKSFDKKLREYVYPQLKQEPHHGPNIRSLQGYEPLTRRYRIGDFRLFYSIDEGERIVFLLTIDDRKDTYR
jgi:mRNA interferase RelE/StbE